MPRTEEAILTEFYRRYDEKLKQDGQYYKNEYQRSQSWSPFTFLAQYTYQPVSGLDRSQGLNGVIYHALFDAVYNASGVNRTTQVLVDMGLFKDSQGHEIEDIPALNAEVSWAKEERIRVLEERAKELNQQVRTLEETIRGLEHAKLKPFQSLAEHSTSPFQPN